MSGNLLIVTAPSGAGKTSLTRALLAADSQVELSISYTTRAPRPGEENGRDYHFVDRPAFRAMLARGEFLEHAEVYGNLYGTSRPWIESRLGSGRDILLEIDWQGAAQVRALMPRAHAIFIVPPSLGELERRLRGRGQDSEEVIARRMAAARDELHHVQAFDSVIINQDFDEAARDLAALVRGLRLGYALQRERHRELFDSFLEE